MNAISRRSFVSGAAATAIAAASTVAAASAEEAACFEATVDWDAEYDVIVVGFGGAGANTAIAAADEGASVLLLEKAPECEAGGNSIVCVQLLCCVEDVEAMKTYMRAMRGNYLTPSDAIIDVYAEECAKNLEWVQYLGAEDPTFNFRAEWPNLEGSDKYSFITVHPMTADGQAYKLFKDNVEARENIDVWYEAPAVKLIQDPVTRIIHGAVVEVEGKTVNVRAKNGVVLTLGGFENSARYQQDYLCREVEYWPPLGHAIYNEGDGVRMVQEVGANLWHMGNYETNNFEFVDPETRECTWKFDSGFRGIVVGSNGKRFVNEHNCGASTHGHINYGGTPQSPVLPDLCWEVVDQAAFEQGPLYKAWSPDNSEELEKGWILKGDTLEELAAQMGLGEAAAEQLANTVADWNFFCAQGRDYEFGVKEDFLVPLEQGPFYAVQLLHPMVNTQGGAEKNERGEVLDPQGNPIPHLYESGEFGDIWSHLYQGACNLGGGMIFGRISGRNAAAPKDDNFQGSVMEGKTPFAPAPVQKPVYECGENQYLGEAPGKLGPVIVRVTMEGDTIVDVEVLQNWESKMLASKPLAKIPAAIVEANSPSVDVCAGASVTSLAICNAVRDALDKIQ